MVAIRSVQASDLPAISALDARLTGSNKPDYWQEMLAPERHFLVAETDKGALAGFAELEPRAAGQNFLAVCEEFGELAVPPLEAFRSPEGIPPENLKLALPSSFTSDYLDSLGLHALRDKELQLRRGQANDALQAIRVLIGQKSFQFTSNMRNVDPAAAVTRPREAIHALGRTIASHCRVYARCRAAMIDSPPPTGASAAAYAATTQKARPREDLSAVAGLYRSEVVCKQ